MFKEHKKERRVTELDQEDHCRIWRVGSSFSSDLCLTGEGVAAEHLILVEQGNTVLAVPRSSARTLFNGVDLIGPVELRGGDLLALGTVTLRWAA